MQRMYRVLLAEDDENSAKVVIHLLEKYNFDVTHVPDGMAALTRVRVNKFDLIISDIMMPYLDGLGFVEKGQEFIRDTPVILLTAVGDRKNVLRAAQFQVNQYILKPIDVDSLMEKVIQAIQLQPGDLIEKKQFPFQIHTLENSDDNCLMVLMEGCPKKNSGEIHAKTIIEKLSAQKNLMSMDISIQEIFFLESSCFRILDEICLRVIKATPLRGANIRIFAPEIRDAKLDPDKFPNLLSCKIESRT